MTACDKKPYADQRTARIALESILKGKAAKAVRTPSRVYPCDTCEAWHLTSRPLSGKAPAWDIDPNWTRPTSSGPEQDPQTMRYKKQDKLVRALAQEYSQLTEHGRVEFALSAPENVYRAFGALMAHARKTRDE